jgi:hypothetical protein
MGRIFIDLTEDESHWNGRIDISLVDSDGLTGENQAIRIGDHEIILTIPQLVTLFDLLDGWMNGAPLTNLGEIDRRISVALKQTCSDLGGAVRMMNENPTGLAHYLKQELQMAGLRFRVKEDEPLFPKRAYRRRTAAKEGDNV